MKISHQTNADYVIKGRGYAIPIFDIYKYYKDIEIKIQQIFDIDHFCFIFIQSFVLNLTGIKRSNHPDLKDVDFSKPLTFKISQRGRPLLCFLGHRYRKDRVYKNGREYWRCVKLNCHGRLTIFRGKISKYRQHSHTVFDE